MISRLIGQIIEKNEDNITILVFSQIGIKVFVPNEISLNLNLNDKITLFTHLIVRENLLNLYGFLTKEESNLFELLMTVSGIGPKSALNIINHAKFNDLVCAIQTSDYSILTKISGIGKKTAERIVLELNNKIKNITQKTTANFNEKIQIDLQAIEALQALGYSNLQARDALNKINKDQNTNITDKIKAALKLLGKNN